MLHLDVRAMKRFYYRLFLPNRIDANQGENCCAPSKAFHGSSVQMKHVMREKIAKRYLKANTI